MNTTASNLLSKITSHSAVVGIVGLGYVGLPLAIAFAEKGFPVLGFDVDGHKVDAIGRGESYIKHLDGGRLADVVKAGTLTATTDFDRLSEPDAVLICVPTPLTPQREPEMCFVEGTAGEIAQRLRPGQLVVLESTTYPGTTDELVRGILEKGDLRCGETFFLAFSPEREDPGNPNYGTTTIPKVIGGVDPVSGDLAEALYAQAIKRTVRVSSARTAEATKLTENIFRAVNIALVNELKIVYDRMGIDVWEVLDAAESKPFGFMRFNPGPGWGGHCLTGDQWVRVRGHGLHGLYRFEQLYRLLRRDCEAVITRGGLYLETPGLQTLAVDPETCKPGWFPVLTLYRGAFRGKGVRVMTEGGQTVEATDQHPFLEIQDHGLETVPARALRAGMRLPAVCERREDTARPGERIGATIVLETEDTTISGHVYSLEVERARSFTTNGGIVVHNCIPLDPFYLAWKAREHGLNTKFIELAGEVNIRMPHWVIEKLQLALNNHGKPVKGSKILVLGLAYKKDIDDPRESPAFELIDALLGLGADVSYHDPHIPEAPRMRSWPDLPPMTSQPLTAEMLATTDAVLIATNHSTVDYDLVATHAPLIIDTRGVYRQRRQNVVKA